MTTVDTSSDSKNAASKENAEQPAKAQAWAEELYKSKVAWIIDEHHANRLCLEVRLLTAGVFAKTFSTSEAAMAALVDGDLDAPDVMIVGEGASALEPLQVARYIERVSQAAMIPQLNYGMVQGELSIVQAQTLGAVARPAEASDNVDIDQVLAELNLTDEIRNAVTTSSSQCEGSSALEVLTDEVDASMIVTKQDETQQQGDPSQPQTDCDQSQVELDQCLADVAHQNSYPMVVDEFVDELADEDAMQAQDAASVCVEAASDDCAASLSPTADREEDDLRSERHQSGGGLMTTSASNDAESFREHSSVVAYLRALERKNRGASLRRRKSDRWDPKRREQYQQKLASEKTFEAWREALSAESRHSSSRVMSLESQRLEFQERLDRSLESMQHQFEFELMRQTSAIQESLGHLMAGHTESIEDQIRASGRRQRVDRWLNVLMLVMLILMPSLWLLTQHQTDSASLVPSSATAADDFPMMNTLPKIVEREAAAVSSGLSVAERDRVMQAVEQLLNTGAGPQFGTLALGAREAERLERALEMLSVVGFEGEVQVINHVSPYCVQYDNGSKPILDETQEMATSCFLMPANLVDAQSEASAQSIEFDNLLSRYNQSGAPMAVVVMPAVDEGDYWSVTETIQPSATGEQLTASEWNDRAQLRNRVEYRLMPRSE